MVSASEDQSLDCHFSSGENEGENPWIKINFKENAYVTKVKFFAIQNGIKPSNLEEVQVYIGEVLCGTLKVFGAFQDN